MFPLYDLLLKFCEISISSGPWQLFAIASTAAPGPSSRTADALYLSMHRSTFPVQPWPATTILDFHGTFSFWTANYPMTGTDLNT
jgi:hypothetical protein